MRDQASVHPPAEADDDAIASWVRLLKGNAEVRRLFNGALQRDHGISITDYEVLVHLSRAPERSLRRVDLVQRLSLTASGITRLLDGMKEAGWVAKRQCDADARVTYAELTDAGLEKLTAASDSHVEAVRSFFRERYSDEELATLAELLGRLPGAAGGDEACGPPD